MSPDQESARGTHDRSSPATRGGLDAPQHAERPEAGPDGPFDEAPMAEPDGDDASGDALREAGPRAAEDASDAPPRSAARARRPQPAHEPKRYRDTIIFPASLDPDAVAVVRRLVDAGFESYLVGGCVRDLLCGRIPKDFDVSTRARPRQIRTRFRNCRVIGRRFKLAHIHFRDKIIEVATFRATPEDEGAGEGDDLLIVRDNEYGTAEEDVLRRDFTINALLYDVIHDEVIDWVGGVEDLERRVLSTIGDPVVRLAEDPVRMLRALKFKARLGLQLDPALDAAMHGSAPLIGKSSPPRVLEEIYKLTSCGRAVEALPDLLGYGLLAHLLPEVSDWWAAHRDRLAAVGAALDVIDRGARRSSNAMLLAALFLEPWHAAVDEGADPAIAVRDLTASAARRMSIPRRDVAALKQLLLLQLRLERNKRSRRVSLRDFLARSSTREALELLYLAALSGHTDPDVHARWVQRLVHLHGEQAALSAGTGVPDEDDEEGDDGEAPRRRRRPRRRGRGSRSRSAGSAGLHHDDDDDDERDGDDDERDGRFARGEAGDPEADVDEVFADEADDDDASDHGDDARAPERRRAASRGPAAGRDEASPGGERRASRSRRGGRRRRRRGSGTASSASTTSAGQREPAGAPRPGASQTAAPSTGAAGGLAAEPSARPVSEEARARSPDRAAPDAEPRGTSGPSSQTSGGAPKGWGGRFRSLVARVLGRPDDERSGASAVSPRGPAEPPRDAPHAAAAEPPRPSVRPPEQPAGAVDASAPDRGADAEDRAQPTGEPGRKRPRRRRSRRGSGAARRHGDSHVAGDGSEVAPGSEGEVSSGSGSEVSSGAADEGGQGGEQAGAAGSGTDRRRRRSRGGRRRGGGGSGSEGGGAGRRGGADGQRRSQSGESKKRSGSRGGKKRSGAPSRRHDEGGHSSARDASSKDAPAKRLAHEHPEDIEDLFDW